MSLIDYAIKGNIKKFDDKLTNVSIKYNLSKPYLYANFIKCFLKIGSGYSDYLNYELYKRSNDEINAYATIKTQDYFYEIVSPSKYKTTFTVKNNFLEKFAKYIYRDSFYKGTYDELAGFLNRNEKIMYKPNNSLGGDRVRSIIVKDITDFKAFYNEIINNDILLEGYVKQHSEIAKFAPNSVNTIRVMTFGYNGKSKILCAIMRIGNGIADVDNFHQGGMGVEIDVDTGIVLTDAIDKDNNRYEVHPVSKLAFKGFKIPNWDIVVKTCLEATLVDEHIHCVGWDVAVTQNGCTFIEGNRRPGYDLPQVILDKGRKYMMTECLNEINENEGTNYKV